MKFSFLSILIFTFAGISGQSTNTSTSGDNFKRNDLRSGQCLNHVQRAQIENELENNRNELIKKGILNPVIVPKANQFDLPIKAKDGFNDPGYYTISSYYDHDMLFPDHLLDFNCGQNTYDTEDGYNHEGTDFFLWPFPWYKMDNDQVEVVAAASGIILYKQDGNDDQNCDGEDLPWNAIFIQHSNGVTTWYGHFKNGSITEKNIGETVEIGEYLGIVGSSGISFQPHLHFEIHDEENNAIDPYEGLCNQSIDESLWLNQRPYIDAGINRITTNSKLPVFPECPQQEILNESNQFSGNDTVFLLLYFRNLSTDDSIHFTITRPDNSIHSHWIWKNSNPFYTATWNYWFLILKNDQDGLWQFEANYKNTSYSHQFQYSNSSAISENNSKQLMFFPNPANSNIEIILPEAIKRDFNLQLTNITGQNMQVKLIQKNDKSLLLDIENIAQGTYILTLEYNGEKYYGRLIKK